VSGDAARRNVGQWLAAARVLGVERLDAQLLIARALGRDRSWLLAHDDALPSADEAASVDAALQRRAAGEPLAYLLGEKEFHGLLLQVDRRVLVPRPDTEVLVDWALALLAGELRRRASPAVVDLGTGSGAIALAVAHRHPAARVTATDASTDALEVACANAQRLSLPIEFLAGAWWAPLTGRRFDVVLSNPPYIEAGDPHLAALHSEPASALSPGPTGLEALQAIIVGAADHLNPDAWLLLEHGHDQADAVRALLKAAGFDAIETHTDLAGHARCSGGRL